MNSYLYDFVSISEYCPGVKVVASYATLNNFTGEIIPGYKSCKSLLVREAADALKRVQINAKEMGLCLVVFDGYRPAKAVAFFKEWSERPECNVKLKQLYYPSINRSELFELGYLAKQSSHSRGSAVDLTLMSLKNGLELDMGTAFDYFDTKSHTNAAELTTEQKNNRELFIKLMEEEGFHNYSKEWWHFTFKPETYPDQYFDFDIV